jgi:single-strand DNA-binding protein
MNSVSLIGRISRDPEVRYTNSENAMAIAKFTLAVDRRFNKEQQSADFISCVAFGKTAEHIEKYWRKGMKMGATGRIQTGSYTNRDGQKVYTTDVVIEQVEFCESKGQQTAPARNDGKQPGNDPLADFMNIPGDMEDELPFN